MRAIDLFSGVGGWSLGLRLAGIEVVGSYEFWGAANETNFKNNQHVTQTVDIRNLAFDDLPSDIDIVVGSPPCTQFSYSNRGGGGDLEDGLKDIARFLEIVDFLKPKQWVMENVPRVAKIIQNELRPGGRLAQFQKLGCEVQTFDLSMFGVPQRRKRCFAGNIDFGLLKKYQQVTPEITLGGVIQALSENPIRDPIYGVFATRTDVIDHVLEDFLSEEETRINKANKTTHTVYNSMPFPDPMSRAVRTITATCTRVSRESVVIQGQNDESKFRRLTLRERASLQGFPVAYQFYGNSYSQKLKMIGNAVPPVFSYLVANAIIGTSATELVPLSKQGERISQPRPAPRETPPEKLAKKYPTTRSFKFALPSLRQKSGVRLELSNKSTTDSLSWRMCFYYGSSKKIRSFPLDIGLHDEIVRELPTTVSILAKPILADVRKVCADADIRNMQKVWSHKGPGQTRPFMLLDELDFCAVQLAEILEKMGAHEPKLIRKLVIDRMPHVLDPAFGTEKLERNAGKTLSGFLIGGLANDYLMQTDVLVDGAKAAQS